MISVTDISLAAACSAESGIPVEMMLSESALNYASTMCLIPLCNVYTEHMALDLLHSSDKHAYRWCISLVVSVPVSVRPIPDIGIGLSLA